MDRGVMEQFDDRTNVTADFSGYGSNGGPMSTNDSGGFSNMDHTEFLDLLNSNSGSDMDISHSRPFLASTATNGELINHLSNFAHLIPVGVIDSSYTLSTCSDQEELNESAMSYDVGSFLEGGSTNYRTDHLDQVQDEELAPTALNDSSSLLIDFNDELESGFSYIGNGTSKKNQAIVESGSGRTFHQNNKIEGKADYYACDRKGPKYDNCKVTYVTLPKEVLLAKYTTGHIDEDVAVTFKLEFGVDIWESKQKRGQRHLCEENHSNIYRVQ